MSIHILKKGVKYLSIFVFSTENFKRSEEEVSYLMGLIANMFKKDCHFLVDNNIKLVFSGSRSGLRPDIVEAMEDVMNVTKNNTGGILNICLNYGGRKEIVDTTKKLIKQVQEGQLEIDNIDEEIFSKNLYADLPDIDFLIRTSGEMRLSNFMLWQASYAELYFPKTYFPDFNEEEFDKALMEYSNRNRRFGGVDE